MSYRKITVDNKDYEYTVGRSFLKVKGIGAIDTCELAGITYRDAEKNPPRITPSLVAKYIRENA